MCGFAGVVAWDERFRVSRETLERMSAKVAHRGPDGAGLHLNHESDIRPDRPQVGLVHRRLAILDLDPRADQPFTDHHGRWIVFNGEIYNFRELRAELSRLKPDYAWRTHGDTEVLLLAYDAWGEKCVEHLNGMFAFAVWDERRRQLFLARDRMGQKPLYFAEAPGHGAVAFASELGALRLLRWPDWSINPLSLHLYLRFGFGESMTTIYKGIDRLPPAGAKRFRKDGFEWLPGYFLPNAIDPSARSPDASDVHWTRRLVAEAVRRQLVADVPLGCFLSGGVDSSVIAAAMKAAVPPDQPVLTFSIGFDDPRYDETRFAAKVAEHLGTKHHQFTVRPDAAADLPKLAEVFGEPFGDSSALPTHYLSRETRKHVKVVLSGDGGDELFGGYDRYRAMAMARRLECLPASRISREAARIVNAVPGTHPKSRIARLKRFVASLRLPPGERYAGYMSIFDWPTLRELLRAAPSLDIAGGYISAGYSCEAKRREAVPAALAVDRDTYLPDDLLTKLDRASMLHALEVRSPFMDHELVQFAAGLSTEQLLKGGPKRMLREAFAQDLPPWVFRRKKMGFAVPIGEWFRGELRPMLRDHLFAADSFTSGHFHEPTVQRLLDEHEHERVDHSQRLYALLMLELWWKQYGR